MGIPNSRAYFAAPAPEFLRLQPDAVLGALTTKHSFDLDNRQRDAWRFQIAHLQATLANFPSSFLFLEFAIPRMGKRTDAVILSGNLIFVIEYKVGATEYTSADIDQVTDYAIDLKNFHEGSHNANIVPVLVATRAAEKWCAVEFSPDLVNRTVLTNADGVISCFRLFESLSHSGPALVPERWVSSRYKPTPTIVEAARALYRGHDVKEISRSESGAENLSKTTHYIDQVIDNAKQQRKKAVCFVTGVPGSGKTLAGLSLATDRMRAHDDEHAVFLSGNGPLVDVLREALAHDQFEQARESSTPIRKNEAFRHASTFIQNIHHFRDEYLRGQVPVEKVVVFDEAQRAWTKEHASRFMREKRGIEDFDQSEPAFLLSVMDRHPDWCVVVCLIGGGQEINTGEAGLGEWLAALQADFTHWEIHTSDRLSGDDYLGNSPHTTTANHARSKSNALHLSVSVRSFRAELVSEFVGAIIDGNVSRCRELCQQLKDFPIALTRSLEAARDWLRSHARGSERIGLVASSNALRLKPVGLHVKAKVDPPTWFLAPRGDVRSSIALEDVGSEFDVQGLELDWVSVCWDANLRYEDDRWRTYNFRGTRWEAVNSSERAAYLVNSYRVLLTRARQGMVIFVPEGSSIDATRIPPYYDGTYAFLRSIGIPHLGK